MLGRFRTLFFVALAVALAMFAAPAQAAPAQAAPHGFGYTNADVQTPYHAPPAPDVTAVASQSVALPTVKMEQTGVTPPITGALHQTVAVLKTADTAGPEVPALGWRSHL